jgi:hypothetical protein
MFMVKKIILGLVALLALFFIYVAVQPAEYVISREITINAPAEKIFPYLNNSKMADQWGPWKEEDPQAKYTFSGPDDGVGSKASWTEGKKLGTGSATIVESVPNERVGVALEYQEPMNMTQRAEYSIKSMGPQSVVSWKVEGKNNFMGRIMCTFFDMDNMVGGFFEKGLSNLKTLVEKQG